MRKLDQRGVAAIPIVVIVLVSTGAAVATPVVVDVADVDPDSPLYGLERLGERIRMIGDEDQMKERWSEYVSLVDRAKGLEYKHILEEFAEKMSKIVSGDSAPKQEIVRWMQEQMPGVGLVRLKLMKELGEELKDKLPEVSSKIENEIDVLKELEKEISSAVSKPQDNVQARAQLTFQHLWQIAERQSQIPKKIEDAFDIENMLADVNATVNVEVNITIVNPVPIISPEFENRLEKFNESLAEVQAMLEGTPENAPGRHAAERLINLATEFKEKAVTAYNENRVRKALVLINVAQVHLNNAKRILEHASEWEPEFAVEWSDWKEIWENMKQSWVESGTWQSILENYQQHAQQITSKWQEEWQDKLQTVSGSGSFQKD